METGTALEVRRLGLRPYQEVWELQRELQKKLIASEAPETLLLCEHPPVITIGRSGKKSNILVAETELAARGVTLFEVERGGDVTYHCPGQLVAYPIINLSTKKRDVGWYMRTLEEVVIQTLQEFDIKGLRVAGKTGVWTQPTENAIDFRLPAAPATLEYQAKDLQKIASLGVRISRWCTMHGISLNVRDCREGFRLINPCGFTEIEMSSIEQVSGEVVSIEAVQSICIERFAKLFGFTDLVYRP
ncbi:MAG: lipoyl(octanoyl) transferase LipB [Deltaproteobacteria bacterium]|nr:lipoyl(octanoyl) transferase LipB [Deltaproteobacteria bacterium]